MRIVARSQILKNWLANKNRRRAVIISIAIIAALASTLHTINSYGNDATKLPSGALAWFATSALGAHEVDPQYSQACDTHDHYFPIGMAVDQSGWPISFEYDYFAANYNCEGMFYPIPFVIDCILFTITYTVLLVTIPWLITILRHNKHITRRRVLFAFVACVVAVLTTYGTAYFVRISGPGAHAPPAVSAVITDSYAMPVSFPLCPSGNTTVEKEVCQATGLCALTGISEPSDSRYALQGWPFAYRYSSLDSCFGDSIYPLIFLMDTIFYISIITTAGLAIGHMRYRTS